MYIPQSMTKTAKLAPKAHLEIPFTPVHGGKIVVAALVEWEKVFPVDPTKRSVELFPPGSTTPIAHATSDGLEVTTVLTHAISESAAGQPWRVRVTNEENATMPFRLTVNSPGPRELKTIVLPVKTVQNALASLFTDLHLRVHRGTNASFVRLPAVLGLPEFKFSAPELDRKLDLPFPLPDVRIRAYTNGIDSRSVGVELLDAAPSFRNGAFRLTVAFEERGRELLGTFHADMRGTRLVLDLPVRVHQRKLSYDPTSATAKLQSHVKLVNLPDFADEILDSVLGFSRLVERSIESAVLTAFRNGDLCASVTSALHAAVTWAIQNKPNLLSARVENGDVHIEYWVE